MWVYNLSAGQSHKFRPKRDLILSNASLSSIIHDEKGRCSLRLGYGTTRSNQFPASRITLATFVKNKCDNAKLNLRLSAECEYVLTALGENDLDVIGYEPWDTKTLHGDSEDDGDVGEEEEVKGQDWDEDRQSVKSEPNSDRALTPEPVAKKPVAPKKAHTKEKTSSNEGNESVVRRGRSAHQAHPEHKVSSDESKKRKSTHEFVEGSSKSPAVAPPKKAKATGSKLKAGER